MTNFLHVDKDIMGTAMAEAEHDSLTLGLCRSLNRSEITPCEFHGSEAELLDALRAMWTADIDHATLPDRQVDAWGFSDDTPEGKQDWRLTVTLLNPAQTDDEHQDECDELYGIEE